MLTSVNLYSCETVVQGLFKYYFYGPDILAAQMTVSKQWNKTMHQEIKQCPCSSFCAKNYFTALKSFTETDPSGRGWNPTLFRFFGRLLLTTLGLKQETGDSTVAQVQSGPHRLWLKCRFATTIHTKHVAKIIYQKNCNLTVTTEKHSISVTLTLLAGCLEEHLACKNWVMRCWCGYLSGVRCRLFAHGPTGATAIPETPTSVASFKSRLVLPFWTGLPRLPWKTDR